MLPFPSPDLGIYVPQLLLEKQGTDPIGAVTQQRGFGTTCPDNKEQTTAIHLHVMVSQDELKAI